MHVLFYSERVLKLMSWVLALKIRLNKVKRQSTTNDARYTDV